MRHDIDFLMEAGDAWKDGEWRQCADRYVQAHPTCEDNGWRCCCVCCFAHLVLDRRIEKCGSDVVFLQKIARELTSSTLERVWANYALACIAYLDGYRDKSANHYCRMIQLIRQRPVSRKASRQQRKESTWVPEEENDKFVGYKRKPVAIELQELCDYACSNLETLEGGGNHFAEVQLFLSRVCFNYRSPEFYKFRGAPDVRANMQHVLELLRVRCCRCNHCNRSVLDDAFLELRKCNRCAQAWYCSKRCQHKAWSSHKLGCREKEQIQIGDFVSLRGSCAGHIFGSAIAEVVAAETLCGPGYWQVLHAGVTYVVHTENMQPLLGSQLKCCGRNQEYSKDAPLLSIEDSEDYVMGWGIGKDEQLLKPLDFKKPQQFFHRLGPDDDLEKKCQEQFENGILSEDDLFINYACNQDISPSKVKHILRALCRQFDPRQDELARHLGSFVGLPGYTWKQLTALIKEEAAGFVEGSSTHINQLLLQMKTKDERLRQDIQEKLQAFVSRLGYMLNFLKMTNGQIPLNDTQDILDWIESGISWHNEQRASHEIQAKITELDAFMSAVVERVQASHDDTSKEHNSFECSRAGEADDEEADSPT